MIVIGNILTFIEAIFLSVTSSHSVTSKDGSYGHDCCCRVSCDGSSFGIFVVPCLNHFVKDGSCHVKGHLHFHPTASKEVSIRETSDGWKAVPLLVFIPLAFSTSQMPRREAPCFLRGTITPDT